MRDMHPVVLPMANPMIRLLLTSLVLSTFLLAPSHPLAADPIPPIPRRIPPQGKPLPTEIRQQLHDQLGRLQEELSAGSWDLHTTADVAIYLKAVDYALRHGEFYKAGQHELGEKALQQAQERLAALRQGKHPWKTATGLVVRGYRSSIDQSPQPYGLVIPKSLKRDQQVPLYVWLHGRGDSKTDLHFIHERQNRPGQVAPPNAIVLHPFGRQCIGYKSAGEIDVMEAIEHVCQQYPVDRQRIVLMGFSMGGAGCWHLGAHYTDRFIAMSPGAGFAETAQYNRMAPENYPAWYVQRLWGQYDVPGYVRNLFNLPVVAYSGEKDKQIQAARVMEQAFQREGQTLTHLIGPGMGHRYHPDSLKSIVEQMQQASASRRPLPKRVTLQTQTLRYPKMHWVTALRLTEHWQDSRIDAEIVSDRKLRVHTQNIAALQLTPWGEMQGAQVEIDDTVVTLGSEGTLHRQAGKWRVGEPPRGNPTLVKRHGQQGPIDDAFLAPFVVVVPASPAAHPGIQSWIDFEIAYLKRRWRALFRGELPVKTLDQVTPEDLLQKNLVLFGTPQSNPLIRKYLPAVVSNWDEQQVVIRGQAYPANTHLPLLIYPQSGEQKTYVVINSGPTFRDDHDRTNSLQNPKLPDWAVIDIRQPPNGSAPGKVVAADFFDEHWQLKTTKPTQ